MASENHESHWPLPSPETNKSQLKISPTSAFNIWTSELHTWSVLQKKAGQVPNSVLILTVQALVLALSRLEACGLKSDTKLVLETKHGQRHTGGGWYVLERKVRASGTHLTAPFIIFGIWPGNSCRVRQNGLRQRDHPRWSKPALPWNWSCELSCALPGCHHPSYPMCPFPAAGWWPAGAFSAQEARICLPLLQVLWYFWDPGPTGSMFYSKVVLGFANALWINT